LVNTISFIIQNARIHLVKTIKNIVDDGGLFLYCDTDSLIVAVKKSVNMNNYMKIHNLNLGE
jgi:DNA polymerase elongation subunit (family B)